MNFVTLEFSLFFLIVLTIWWTSQNAPLARRFLLLAANLTFYAATGITFVPLLVGAACINWGAATLMNAPGGKTRRKAWLAAGISADLCLLAFFKYYEFLVMELSAALGIAGLHLPVETLLPGVLADMAFPVGISFYMFQGISYLVDQYRQPELPPQPFVKVLLFLSFFPTVLSGPIVRANQFFPQLDALTSSGKATDPAGAPLPPPPLPSHAAAVRQDAFAIQEGFALILSGLFKKVVLASYLADHVVRDAFQGPEGFSSWGILIAVYGYSMQLYCDFSGYTDMALGIGRLMGFTLPQNFASPYLACDLQDFWRRWHMTLSSWLRDYLYIPLGGSRYGHTYRNLLLTMLLGGLWHGAHTRFIIWGFMHGIGLCFVHAVQRLRKSVFPGAAESALWRGLAWLLTFHFVTAAWIFFGAESTERALEILKRIFFWGQEGSGFPVMALPAIACAMVSQMVGGRLLLGLTHMQLRLPLPAQAAVIAVLCGLILRMGPDGVLPFIYFQF